MPPRINQSGGRVHSFLNCRRVGDYGSKVCQNYLKGLPETVGVCSVEQDKRYQVLGIDYFWLRHVGTRTLTHSVEVKTDTWDTGNFYLELVSNVELEKPGWMFSSEAEWLSYVIVPTQKLYMMPLEELRDWYLGSIFTDSKYWKTTFTGSRNSGYKSQGVPCPIEEVLSQITHRQIDINDIRVETEEDYVA